MIAPIEKRFSDSCLEAKIDSQLIKSDKLSLTEVSIFIDKKSHEELENFFVFSVIKTLYKSVGWLDIIQTNNETENGFEYVFVKKTYSTKKPSAAEIHVHQSLLLQQGISGVEPIFNPEYTRTIKKISEDEVV